MARVKKRGARPRSRKKLSRIKSVLILAVILLLTGSFIFIRNYLSGSNVFNIEKVEIRGDYVYDSDMVKELSKLGIGENIFRVNIRDLEARVRRKYAEISDIRIGRVFPNRLVFNIDRRIPVALINSRYFYPVDKEGVILKNTGETIQADLPIIDGIYIGANDVGRKLSSAKLDSALKLIEALSKSRLGESSHVSKIDAANNTNLSFYIDDGLQVKIGGENFKERLELLEKTLNDPSVKRQEILYIDLRFKDIIIGPK